MPDPDAYEFHRPPNTAANQFQGQHIVSDQVSRDDLGVIWRELEKILQANVPGDVVEFGCYVGTTSLFIRRLLDRYEAGLAGDASWDSTRPRGPQGAPEGANEAAGPANLAPSARIFHVYDSFEGLPPKRPEDASPAGTEFQAGKLAVSKKIFMQQFRAAGLRPPVVHKNWFDQLDETDIPEHIAFAFLDGDFYDSIMTSLKLVWPRMSPHGTILIDDYKREALPGAERAIRHFFQGKTIKRLHGEHNIAIIEL